MKPIKLKEKNPSPPPLQSRMCKRSGLLHPSLFMLLIFLVAARPADVFAQAPLFTYHTVTVLSEQQKQKASAWIHQSEVSHYEYATINNQLLTQNNLFFNFKDGHSVQVTKKEVVERQGKMYSWFGKFDNDKGNVNLVVNGDMITGTYHTVGTKIQILPIGNGMHLLLWINNTSFPKDESDEGYKQMLQPKKKNTIIKNPEANSNAFGGDCKVRILVAYTDDVAASFADVAAFVQSCIDVTNIAYNNSLVSFDVELARSIEVNYTETGSASTDLARFETSGDGYMDEIFDARVYYDADICALIVDNLSNCGLASRIQATYSEAFCVVASGCAVGNYSFPHELGHLYACRHDEQVDPTSTPYAFGHGYVYPPDLWRTIMAYPDYCPGCDRLGYFSNPGVTYGGVPMGTVSTNDNESVHEIEANNIAQLEVTVSAKSFPSEVIDEDEIGDVIAGTSVTNSSTYTIQPGASVSWRAGSSITMTPGFTALSGSSFRAFLDGCSELLLGDKDRIADSKISNSQSSASIEKNNRITTSQLKLFPNPASNYITIQSASAIDRNSCFISDVLGKKIPCSWQGTTNTLNISGLTSGVYFIHFMENGKVISLKFVKQ